MARAERTGSSGRLAKGLLESVSEALLRADFGAVASSGPASVCGVGYSKGNTDFGCGGQGRISGSKLLFEVVSKTNRPRSNQMAQVIGNKSVDEQDRFALAVMPADR